MPALFVFLLKVNIALLLFCAGYYLVLRHLTFYTLNRIYLVGAILFATIYPQINLDSFAQRHQQLTQPVQAMVLHLQNPAETLVKPLVQPIYWQWAEVVFFAGAVFLAIRLLMQLFSLYKVYRDSKSAKIFGHSVRVIDTDGGPFSFWKNIYINPKGYSPSDLYRILLHEQVHADELHTLDILVAELSIIFYWFNPGVWLMRKAVRENIEFITDRKILQKGVDSKSYQYSLLNVSFATTQPGIANHFNISTLKKRIIMMNAKKSSKANLTRYALLMPVVLLCLLSFSFSKAELIKKGKKTYKVFTLSVATITDVATTNPVTKSISTFFMETKPAKKDTIKVIRSGSKDTIKLVRPSTISNFVYEFKNGEASVRPEVLNLTLSNNNRDTSTIRKVMINGHVAYIQGGKASVVYNFNSDTSVLNGLAGKVAGLQVTTSGVGAAQGARVQLRGSRSGMGDTKATIIVDGVPLANGAIPSIDPNKIASYDIQRDAANPNGVIIITTKNGKQPYTTAKVTLVDSLLDKMHGFAVTKEGMVTHFGDTITHARINGVDYNGKNIPRIVRGMPGRAITETSVQDISDKLVFIDGKEVSAQELKKIPVSNIETMIVRSGDEVIKKYGDKAKDGVVFLTLKKNK